MNEQPITRIAFVDDHTLVRSGLVGLVNKLDGYSVVLEAGDGSEFTEAMRKGPAVDLAIIDLNMPVMDGIATIEWMHRNHPQVLCLVLTFDHSETAVIRAMRNGARGFLLKNTTPKAFKLALDSVRDTGYFENDLVYHSTIPRGDLKTPYERQQAKMLAAITAREMEFIKLACDPIEYTYDEIADRMGTKPSTAETYRKHLFDRFGIKSKAGLVIFAYRWGIVKVELR